MILTAHIVLLVLFVGATTVLLVAAVMNRMRTQPVRMIWYRRGAWSGFGWPTVFLIVFVGAIMYAGLVENSFYIYLGLGYLAGGICWSIASRLSSATIITDFAIIRDTSKCGNVLCWNQVVDYFVRDKGRMLYYTFLYVNPEGAHARFEVQVPQTHQPSFDRMINRYLEREKTFAPERAYG